MRFVAFATNLFALSLLSTVVINNAENPSYDQGVYKPDFLNYCYEDRAECSREACTCMLDRKCMLRPLPVAAIESITSQHDAKRREKTKNEPRASGMPRLEYDLQLESIAQCWAAKCKNAKTDCLLTESYSYVGMNVGMIRTEDLNASPFLETPYSDSKPIIELWKTTIEVWSKDIDVLEPNAEWKAKGAGAAYGAQMIHDQTLALGCAWSASPEGSFFFCAYGPGLRNDTSLYKTGASCATCPPGLKCTDKSGGLCTKYVVYPQPVITAPPHQPPRGYSRGRPPRVDFQLGPTTIVSVRGVRAAVADAAFGVTAGACVFVWSIALFMVNY